MGNCDNCMHYSEIVNRLEQSEKNIETLTTDVKALQQSNIRSSTQIEMVFDVLNKIQVSIDGISKELKDLALKPGKRWDGIINTLLSTGIGAIIGIIISKLFS